MIPLFGEYRTNVIFRSTRNKDPNEGKSRDVREEKSQELLGTPSLAFIEGIEDDENHRSTGFDKREKRFNNT